MAKRSGKRRRIDAPVKELCTIQRQIHEKLTKDFSIHPAARGFVQGKSIRDNAGPHVGHKYFLKLDLKDFFQSIFLGYQED